MLTKNDRRALKEQNREYKQQERELKKFKQEKSKTTKGKKAISQKSADMKKILSVFPIRDYQDGFFLTADNRIIDLFQVQGRSYYEASDEEVENLVLNFAKVLRTYSADMKLIGMNYPTNTKLQQAFLAYKLKQPELEKYEDILREKLEDLQTLEQTTTDRETFLMVFANNQNHYDSLCRILTKVTDFSIKSISRDKKENILFQMNNMNKCVKI